MWADATRTGAIDLRKPLTTTHPHGHVLVRRDKALGLLRISKNASTESKVRLECAQWVHFDDFDGPVVAFLRNPVSRFVSGVPETMLRMTHFVAAENWRGDRVEVAEDIYSELVSVAAEPIATVIERFLDLVEYSFFDAHHEPQHAFLSDRQMRLRIDPRLYLTESFEDAVAQIEARTGVKALPQRQQGNRGGAKPQAGRTKLIDIGRKASGTGVYRTVKHSGFLGMRYNGHSGAMQLRDLNALANRFTREVKGFDMTDTMRERILSLYAFDQKLWTIVTERGGDVAASEVWDDLLA